LIVAADLATFPVITVTPDDDLHTALRRFTSKNIDELPVVSPDDPRQVLGMLRRKEVILAYDQHFEALRTVKS
jgi:CIC family chloride channel protein